jgi:hypothetical protein
MGGGLVTTARPLACRKPQDQHGNHKHKAENGRLGAWLGPGPVPRRKAACNQQGKTKAKTCKALKKLKYLHHDQKILLTLHVQWPYGEPVKRHCGAPSGE